MSDERTRTAELAEQAEVVVSEAGDTDAAPAETEDRLRRALADLDNLRKRYHRELARERDAERRRAAMELLPVVDNLGRALDHVGPEDGAALDCAAFIRGIRAVHDQAVGALARLGFERFDDLGQVFDPVRDEAVGAVDSDAPAGTVVAAVRPGYARDGELLRPAGVVVSKGSG